MTLPVYLDNHATTRVDPRVIDAMMPFWSENYGNASSRQHEFGWRAEAAVENARKQVALLVGASADEVIFTGGATESINLALKGVAEASGGTTGHIITAATEHRAVLDTARRLEGYGFRVTVLPVDGQGTVDPDAVDQAITRETILVSVMAANNEIGTIALVREIGTRCSSRGILFHTDATQAAGKVGLDLHAMHVDLLSMSAHKMHGPKGVGALVVRSRGARPRIAAQIDGGGHEHGLRSGTLNVPGIVGYGAAAAIADREWEADAARMRGLRDALVQTLTDTTDGVILNGHPERRLPNNANLTFEQAPADRVMMELKDIALSSGSACSTAQPEPSHVLRAIGRSPEQAKSSLRIGLSRFTTAEEIEFAGRRIAEAVQKVRTRRMVTSFASSNKA
jgi:cysteine desulfurase